MSKLQQKDQNMLPQKQISNRSDEGNDNDHDVNEEHDDVGEVSTMMIIKI